MKRSMRHLSLLLFGINFAIGSGVDAIHAQDAQISVSSAVDKARITIGDLITYTVTVVHDEDVTVELPGLGANLGGFEIRDYAAHDPVKRDGQIVSSAAYVISTFMTGEFEIPPLTVLYTTPGDTLSSALRTEPIQIVVESVKPSEAGDIRDIKPPVEIPRNWLPLIRWIVFAVVALTLTVAGIILYRRKKAGKGLLPVRQAPSRPPHELALEALDRLKASDLLARGEIKMFYINLSEIIRQYLEGRYFITAMEMTTTEVMNDLAGVEISLNDLTLIRTFLDSCDLVKFAKRIPSGAETADTLQMAYTFVERTRVLMEAPRSDVKSPDSQEENADPTNSDKIPEPEVVPTMNGRDPNQEAQT